jgi:hypothetical protein
MRGDQLARQWRIIRAIEASPNGLTETEIAQREETEFRTINRDLKALQAAGFSYPCHAKAQRAPREIFRLLLSFLDIFLATSHSIRKTKGFSARSSRAPDREASAYSPTTLLDSLTLLLPAPDTPSPNDKLHLYLLLPPCSTKKPANPLPTAASHNEVSAQIHTASQTDSLSPYSSS